MRAVTPHREPKPVTIPRRVSERSRRKALETLDGMRTIVKNEMIGRVGYISDEVDERRAKAGAVCRGHKACAIGSLWLAYGVKVKVDRYVDPRTGKRNPDLDSFELPGIDDYFDDGNSKEDFVANKPALKLALGALNEAADEFAERHDMPHRGIFVQPIESLFEGYWNITWGSRLKRADMLKIISAAKRKVKAA